MGLFSRNKEKNTNNQVGLSESISEWNKQETNKIPRILPNTLMQNLSVAEAQNQQAIENKRLFTDDIKESLKTKPQIKPQVKVPIKAPAIDEHKKISQDIHDAKEKAPDNREVERVLMIKDLEAPMPPLVSAQASNSAVSSSKHDDYHHSFFVELERRLFGQKHDVKHIISQDMMAKMKEYHDAMGKGDSFFMHEMDIDKEIEKSLTSLRDMETEWLLTKRGVATAERLLFEKEDELERKLGDFRNLLTTADKFKKFNALAPEGNAFLLAGGIKLYTVQHLMNELPRMDEAVFFAHVTPHKNDFASWINDVFKLEDLAVKIGSAKTKQEILEILKNY
jgi:hypothetical protein